MAEKQPFDVDDTVVSDFEFKVNDVLTDPTTVAGETLAPDGTLTPYTFPGAAWANPAPGKYSLEWVATQAGYWQVRAVGTGAAPGTFEETVYVRPSPFFPDAIDLEALTTVPRVLSTLRLKKGVKDDEVQSAIYAYSRAIRWYTGREFVPRTPFLDTDPEVTRSIWWDGRGESVSLEPFEVRSVSEVKYKYPGGGISPATLSTELWYLGPVNKTAEGTYLWMGLRSAYRYDPPYPVANWNPPWWTWNGPLEIEVTGRWGAGIVPPDVELACRISVANYFRNPESFAGRSVGEMSFTEITDQAPVDLSASLPRDARMLLQPYRRQRAKMGTVSLA